MIVSSKEAKAKLGKSLCSGLKIICTIVKFAIGGSTSKFENVYSL
jgi:hypothetical protein